jgi:hypothetical protein
MLSSKLPIKNLEDKYLYKKDITYEFANRLARPINWF